MFSSQIWIMRSKAFPATLDVGDRGTTVASLAKIELRVGSIVEIGTLEA